MNRIPIEALLLCLLLGVFSGILFSVMETLRILFSLGRIATAILDILFCILVAAATFILALAVSGGNLRFFQAACEIIGFLCVNLTLTDGIRFFLPRFIQRIRRKSKSVHRRMVAVEKIFLRKKASRKPDCEKKRRFFAIFSKKNEKKT